MGWFKNLIDTLAGSAPAPLVFTDKLKMGAQPDLIVPDECYVEVWLESLRLEKARKFTTTLHGAVYAFVDVIREFDSRAQLAAVTKPDKLAAVDPKAADKVPPVNLRLMGPVAWRGDTLHLELGLFAIKSGNLLTPVLDYVTKVSETAGVSFVGAAKPFLPLIGQGLDMLAGQPNDVKIEVGVETDLALTQAVRCAIVTPAKDKPIDVAQLTVDANGRLLENNKPLECAYCIFSVRRVEQKSDYGEIPDIKAAYAAFQAALLKQKQDDAKEALSVFRVTVINSPDLIAKDAKRLVDKAKAKYDATFSAGGLGMAPAIAAHEPELLAAIGLYD
jgi:hypothetical protein